MTFCDPGIKGSTNFYFLRFLDELVCRCINYTLTAYTLLMLFSIAPNNQSKLILSPFYSFLSEKKVLSYIRNIEPFFIKTIWYSQPFVQQKTSRKRFYLFGKIEPFFTQIWTVFTVMFPYEKQ